MIVKNANSKSAEVFHLLCFGQHKRQTGDLDKQTQKPRSPARRRDLQQSPKNGVRDDPKPPKSPQLSKWIRVQDEHLLAPATQKR